ncbi:MAG: 3-deoxy-8-phosphooctulonate synthase [Verrucomicrobia bacterium]|nr:3-deoxy-8-phosphooctulonate synthase [Pseudomonadota bacterium]NBS06187.1 3-deoxy-8-phosphooctulonate synthase [Verrucomicrobiota bacterium]NBS49775.1 3-deoxy-8-phosphooctulonate synthase [Verrucomicrobiota bacterium]NBS79267.1 3-deoxy-8-phosphooctulonate synthase [bacterium]NBY67016.1 3-deoxy-8-phosphooctulonate synthase [Verrucomicrobiota bacterium]
MQNQNKFLLIGGPCVLESRQTSLLIGRTLRDLAHSLGWDYVFKASYDKANRTSLSSPRGPGFKRGLQELVSLRRILKVPVLTDVHSPQEATAAGKFVDILQIPAFLCRQTDLLLAAARTKKAVSVKKGQFLAPEGVSAVMEKLRRGGCKKAMITERGTTFGHGDLVVDMRGLVTMRKLGYPVIFDATHSVQRPGGGTITRGEARYIPALARAAAAVGVDGLFIEVHPNPKKALSDKECMLPLHQVGPLLRQINRILYAIS